MVHIFNTPALQRLRQEDGKVKAKLGYRRRSYQKTEIKEGRTDGQIDQKTQMKKKERLNRLSPTTRDQHMTLWYNPPFGYQWLCSKYVLSTLQVLLCHLSQYLKLGFYIPGLPKVSTG